MKNSAINRIKTFGKAGYIVTVFAKIFMILALVACMAAMIVHRYGRCGASVMILLQHQCLEEHSSAHTTQSARPS